MITITEAKIDRFGESLYSPNDQLEQITRSIEALKQERDRLKSATKYTAEDKRKIAKLTEEIEQLELRQQEGEIMLSLPVGSWVRNGSTTPGRIVDLKFAGKVPEVHVLWWNHTVPVPERPKQLTLLEDSDLEYIWNGDRYPKLVRRIDQIECDEIQVLNKIAGRLAVDKRSAMADGGNDEIIEDYRTKQTYIRKRIIWVNQQDLERLERVVRQGLEIFYRVGSALAEIRDRKLYKQQGYSNFEQYLIEKWDMKRAHAYRLINASEVVENVSNGRQNLSLEKSVSNWRQNEPNESSEKNVSHGRQNLSPEKSVSNWRQNESNESPEKSVSNWGQNESIAYQSEEQLSALVIPKTESIAREVGKAPVEKQKEVWQETVERYGDSPTAKQVKTVVAEIIKPEPKPVPLTLGFEVGQQVVICPPSDRPDKRLIGLKGSKAIVTKVNASSVNLRTWGHILNAVAVQDVKPVDEFDNFTICNSVDSERALFLMKNFDRPQDIIDFVLKQKNYKGSDLN